MTCKDNTNVNSINTRLIIPVPLFESRAPISSACSAKDYTIRWHP